ncbi:hypothetical protein [Halosimplex sp. J119]
MRSPSLLLVAVLVVSALPVGSAVGTVDQQGGPASALSDAASDELVVETTFSLEGTDADEIRVVREFHVGDGVRTVGESITHPIDDVSTRNVRRRGDTFEWDGNGDVARIEYVARADHLGPGPVGTTRGEGYAVVGATYDSIRTDADRLSTNVSVDGEGATGEQFAVLGGYDEYGRDTSTGEYRVVVPDHVDFRGNATVMLDAIEDTDTQVNVGADRDGEATYFVVDLDIGGVAGRTFESRATGNTAGDVLLRSGTNVATVVHEAVHQQLQAYTADDSTRWTVEGGATHYEDLLLWQHGLYDFENFVQETAVRDVDADARLVEPDSWADWRTPYSPGARVIAYIDRELRAATDSERTFEDVLRRMNDHEGTLTHEEFLEIVETVGSPGLAGEVDRYVTTDERPPQPSNPYAYTEPEIDSQLSFTDESPVDRGGGQHRRVHVTLENSGSERSGMVGFNATLPEGWNLTGVAPAAKGARYMHDDPVPGADRGYFEVPSNDSRGFVFYLRLPDNRTEGDYDIDISARDLAGQSPTTAGTIEIELPTDDRENDDRERDEEAQLTGAPPNSSLEKSLDSSAVLGTATHENKTVPVVERGVPVNLSTRLQNDTYPVHSYQFSQIPGLATHSQNGTFSLTPKTQGPKHYHVIAALENGESVERRFWLLVNDPPQVSIDSQSAYFDPTVTMEARVDNDYGDHEIVWLVDGERVGTGEMYRYERTDSPANVTVVVRDEYGATHQDSKTVAAQSFPVAVTRAPVESLSDRPVIGGLGVLAVVTLLLGFRRVF